MTSTLWPTKLCVVVTSSFLLFTPRVGLKPPCISCARRMWVSLDSGAIEGREFFLYQCGDKTSYQLDSNECKFMARQEFETLIFLVGLVAGFCFFSSYLIAWSLKFVRKSFCASAPLTHVPDSFRLCPPGPGEGGDIFVSFKHLNLVSFTWLSCLLFETFSLLITTWRSLTFERKWGRQLLEENRRLTIFPFM